MKIKYGIFFFNVGGKILDIVILKNVWSCINCVIVSNVSLLI